MAERVTVAKASELKPGQAKAVQVQDETIALFNIGGTYYAIEDTCTHSGGPVPSARSNPVRGDDDPYPPGGGVARSQWY